MNQKIKKIVGEIDRTRDKIAEHQNRLKELERQKTELENADIVAAVRSINIPMSEFEAFVRAFMEQRKSGALPDMDNPATVMDSDDKKVDSDEIEEDDEIE